MQRSLNVENTITTELKKELIAIRNNEILKASPEDSTFEQNIYSAEDATDSKSLSNNFTQKSFIERHQFINQDAEYYWVAKRVHQLIQAGAKPSDIGILSQNTH